MKSDSSPRDSLRRDFGGAAMVTGAIILMLSPLIAGGHSVPGGVLIFGLASMFGGWAMMATGGDKPH